MGKNFMGRAETIVHRVVSTMPSGNTNYDIKTNILPPGLYNLAVVVKSNIADTTSTAITITPFADAASTQIADSAFRILEPDASSVATSITSFSTGAAGRYATVVPTATVFFSSGFALSGGIRLAVTKGNASEGDIFEVDLIATRRS